MSVIGEGTYGCVHNPSLKCKGRKLNYTDKISKIESNAEAQNELKQYNIISSIDKHNKMHLGLPIKCDVAESESNIHAIRQCNNHSVFDNLNDYSLLIMRNGGLNLESYADSLNCVKLTYKSKENMKMCWVDGLRILSGIKQMLTHGILHHDIKPQNIVYDETHHRFNLVDFGLMQKMKYIISSSNQSVNWFSEYHWSFPFEIHYYNKNRFMDFVNGNKEDKLLHFIYKIKHGSSDKSATMINTFFSFCLDETISSHDYARRINMYLDDYYDFMIQLNNTKYKEFIKQSANTLDIYGTGIAFIYLLNKSKHLISRQFATELDNLFYLMVTPNLNNRMQIDDLIKSYTTILQKYT